MGKIDQKKEELIKLQINNIVQSMLEAGAGFGLSDLPQNHSLLLVIRELAKTQLELAEVKKATKMALDGVRTVAKGPTVYGRRR